VAVQVIIKISPALVAQVVLAAAVQVVLIQLLAVQAQ
jgi:hypothetical protein